VRGRFRLPRFRKSRPEHSGPEGTEEPAPPSYQSAAAEEPASPEKPGKDPKPAKKAKRFKKPRWLRKPRRFKEPKPPKPPRDLWFRFVTRIRAIGYWIREKAQIVWRALKARAQIAWRALKSRARSVVLFWRTRTPATKNRTYAVAGVLALYAIVKFAPVPGVPCQVSAAKECAPPDETIAFVPKDALLYAHFTIDRDSHQYELASDLSEDLPDATLLAGQVGAAVPTPSGQPIDLAADVLPWAKRDLALTLIPGPSKTALPVFLAGVEDRAGAEKFVASLAPPGKAKKRKQDGADLIVYPAGFAAAFAGDELLFGTESAVRIALDAEAGDVPALEGSGQDQAREELPDVRFAEIYLSRAGVQRLLVGRGAGATQLETFVDYGSTSGMAASLRIKDDGVDVNLVSRLDEKLVKKSPSFFATLPEFEPDLAGEAGERALAYVGVGEVGTTLGEVVAGAGAEAQGLVGSLRALAQTLQKQAGVDPLKDLLPALGGQAALVAEPTDAIPFASLIVDEVDEEKARDALARLQGPLIQTIGTRTGAAARFKETEVEGVKVNSVQVSATVNLSYAVFDGLLVVSTDPAGIAQVRASGDALAGTDAYERVTDSLPDEVSALVFLNLDELLGLAEQAGLAEDPLYASLSDDISNISALGLAVNGTDEQIRSKLFLSLE
jgi:hypothetical protein